MESKIADITLADYGRKDIELSSVEMPGLMSIQEKYKNSKPTIAVTKWPKKTFFGWANGLSGYP